MNLCVFMGNLVEDPQVKTVNVAGNDKSVLTFRIGVNKYINKEKTEATFPTIEAWGTQAELIGKHFAKGDLIRVFTWLKTDTFTDKNSGETRYREKFALDRFEFPETSKRKDGATKVAPEEAADAAEESEGEAGQSPKATGKRGRPPKSATTQPVAAGGNIPF